MNNFIQIHSSGNLRSNLLPYIRATQISYFRVMKAFTFPRHHASWIIVVLRPLPQSLAYEVTSF